MLRYGIPSVCFRNSGLLSLPRMIRNIIPCFCFYFCSTERNSELFSLPRNGSERNSKSLLLFCPMVQKIPSTFLLCLRKWNSESFQFRETAGNPPEQTNCSIYSVFREIIFLLPISNPTIAVGREGVSVFY
jgi:hypothetical protein